MNPTVTEVAVLIASDHSSGISAQGVITLALIVAVVFAVRRPSKEERARRREEKLAEREEREDELEEKEAEREEREEARERRRVEREARREARERRKAGKSVSVPVPPRVEPPGAPAGLSEDLAPFVVPGPQAPPMPSAAPVEAPTLGDFVSLGEGAPWATDAPTETPPSLSDVPPRLTHFLKPQTWNAMTRERKLDGLSFDHAEETPFGVDVHVRFNNAMNFKYVQDNLRQIETGLDCPDEWKVQLKPGSSKASGVVRIVTHDPLADPVVWTEPDGPVRLRDPLWLSRTPFGDDVFLSIKQRIGVFGTSGSGKSCVQRVLAAHVIQSVDADLEVWDFKFGVEAQHYAGNAHLITSLDVAVQRVRWLVEREFPRRAAIMLERGVSDWDETPEDPARVIVIDEGNKLTRGFSAEQMKALGEVFEQGRALGVYFVWATQFPKATNLPSEIRSQINCRISLLLLSSEESRVVFKDDVDQGWSPHTLIGPGWLMIKDSDHREPNESKSRLLSKEGLRAVPLSETARQGRDSALSEAEPGQDSLLSDPGQGSVPEDIWLVLSVSDCPLGVSELSRRTGRSKAAVHGALSRMEVEGQVCRTGTDSRPLFCLPLADR